MYHKKEVLVVLNYHNFSKYNNYKIKRGNILETGYAGNFEKQVRFLEKHFNYCSAEDFFDGKGTKGINIMLTFDDGYKDNYDIAAPILKKHKASTIFFLATAYIGTDKWLWHDKVRYLIQKGTLSFSDAEMHLKRLNQGKPVDPSFGKFVELNFPKVAPMRIMMNWKEITELNKFSFRIGGHTNNHVVLSELDYDAQYEELSKSVDVIEKYTETTCQYIAFPNGIFNADTLEALEALNIDYGLTTKKGINKPDTPKNELKRIGINASDSIYLLLLKIMINTKK